MKNTSHWSRRKFLEFTGRTVGATALSTSISPVVFSAESVEFKPVDPADADEVTLAEGLGYDLLIAWSDPINHHGERFGFNNDYTAFFPLDGNMDDGLLWVNHEEVLSGYFLSPDDPGEKTAANIKQETLEVGGSIIRVKKIDGRWQYIKDDAYNKRIDGTTSIPIIAAAPIQGEQYAKGTVGNCAGGITPWNTVLSCEENFHFFYGDVEFKSGRRRHKKGSYLGWEHHLDHPPEHYGWVVEVDPFSGSAKKLTALGRFAHEGATVTVANDGRAVVYMGDDKRDEHIYKFIAQAPGSLEHGVLFVADTDKGRWLPLHIEKNKKLKGLFSSQTELLIRTREAAKLVGGTPQDRPEDIEIDPETGSVYVALTNNVHRPFGAILKIAEQDNDPLAMEFKAGKFLTGGHESGFACPDNLAFDPGGNLWVCTDISSDRLNKFPYASFKNNGLFYIPMRGRHAGTPLQVASAPRGAEFTGPTFSRDGRDLFLSVQHPGENPDSKDSPSSHWPNGGGALPRPGVITVFGPLLDKLTSVQ